MEAVCRIVRQPISTGEIVQIISAPAAGALATFTGVVRDHHRGRGVDHLEYHAYPEMAAEELNRIARGLTRRHPVTGIGLVHRIGTLAVGEASVLVAVAAPHRKDALACCAAGIEAIKSRLPVWKKEFFSDGGDPEWVFGPDEEICGGTTDATREVEGG